MAGGLAGWSAVMIKVEMSPLKIALDSMADAEAERTRKAGFWGEGIADQLAELAKQPGATVRISDLPMLPVPPLARDQSRLSLNSRDTKGNTMKNYDLSKLPNGMFSATLKDGVHIGADADT